MTRKFTAASYIAYVKQIDDRVRDVVLDLADATERDLIDAIETRGTGRVWKRTYYKRGIARRGSSPGRVWTGQMRDDIGTDIDYGDNKIVTRVGWINRVQDYYELQEMGFDHPSTGPVPGMFAFADAIDNLKKRTKEWLGVALRGR